jgi:divalent metal cation (Fe/Co/Zn/Cd) transporter
MNANTTKKANPVLVALAMNVSVFGIKLVAGLLTGSAAMMAEAAHSAVNSSSEVILLGGELHARKWAKATFFWALVAAVDIFAVGGVYAAYQGVRAMLGNEVADTLTWVALVVLALSFMLESKSLITALRVLAADRGDKSWLLHIRTTTNTSVKTVVYEDSADLLGCVLAAFGIVATMVTGSMIWDGLASVLIGLLLVGMALELGTQNVKLLQA